MHSGKAQLHSGKPSPSATLGEECPGYLFTGNASSPRAKNHALGEGFSESRPNTRGRVDAVGGSRRRFLLKKIFPECNTRGRNPLPRAPQPRHSGKKPSSPSAVAQTLGEEALFPERLGPSTRGRNPLPRVSQLMHSGKKR